MEDRGADTRVCRIETRLDAWRSEASRILRRCSNDIYRWSSAGKSVETSLDAADTSVRATRAWPGRLLKLTLRFVSGRGLKRCESGQTAVEYGILYAGVILPLTFAIIFVAEMLWVWHSVVDFTRDGAGYAATHCWTANGDNVLTYMRTHVPRMIDMDQFQTGQAEIAVQYFSRDPDTGSLTDFTCDGDCSVDCIPDAVTVRVQTYEFRRFVNFLGLPPVVIPDFRSSLPMESAGCDPEQGTCLP